jgi:hypothetical protein
MARNIAQRLSVVFIARTFVEAPEREEVALPEMLMESEPEPERVKGFDQPLVYQNLGII